MYCDKSHALYIFCLCLFNKIMFEPTDVYPYYPDTSNATGPEASLQPIKVSKLPNLLDKMENTCADSTTSSTCPSTNAFNDALQAYTLTPGQHMTYESKTQDTLDITRGFTAVVLARPSTTSMTGDFMTLSTGGTSDQIVVSLNSVNGALTTTCPLGQATVLEDKIWQFSDITTDSAFDAYFASDSLINKDLSGVLPATYTSASVGYTTYETWKGNAVGYMKFTVPAHYTHALVYTANCHSANTVDILHSTDGESSWTTIGQASAANQVTTCFSVAAGDNIKLQETTADICLSSRVHLTTSPIATVDCTREWSLKRQDAMPLAYAANDETSLGLGIYALTTSSNGTVLYAPDSNGNFIHTGIVVADCAGFDYVAGAESTPEPDMTKNLARMCGSGNEPCTGVSSSQLYSDTDTRTNEANAMDGDLVSRWQNAGQETNAWLRIDLSSTQSVLKVKVTFRSDSDTTLPKEGWKIRLGDNNDQTNAVCAGPLTAVTAAENYQAEVTCEGQGQYISIESSSSENIWFSVTEFEVFGPKAVRIPEPDMTKNLARMCGDGTQPCTPSSNSEHSTASTLASVTDADTDFLNSAWVAATDSTNSHWVQVDLGTSVDVLRLKIFFRANSELVLDRANNFEAWIGDTSQTAGSPNKRCYKHAGEAEAVQTVNCQGYGRYIILNFFADTVGVAELEVYGPYPARSPAPDLSVNLARCGAGAGEAGCATSQSSLYSSTSSDTSNLGTDGVTAGYEFIHTFYNGGNGESNPWWRVDFGKTQSVLRVKIWNRDDCCWSKLQGFEVWIGDATTYDGSGNTRCSSGVTFEATAAGREIDADCVGNGQYVFVVIPGSNKILHFLEFEVFGPYPPSSFDLDTATEADTSLNLARACGAEAAAACTVTAKTSHNAGTVTMVNNDDTDWNNGVWYANTDPEYMQIDLGETKNVYNIEIWFSYLSEVVLHRADNFEVWIGDRSALLASPNTMCYEHPGSVRLYENINCQGFGRYVIFRFYTQLVAVAEAKIYGPTDTRVNLARCGAGDGDPGCAVTVSSLCGACTSSFPPTKITDGLSTNTRAEGESWVANDGTSEWLQIDLGETKSVEYIKVWFREVNPDHLARADDFDVYLCGQKLVDSEAFSMHEEHKCHDFQGTPSPVQVVACKGEGRYLTVRFFNPYVGVGEIKVFGPAPASVGGALAPGYRVRLGGPENTNTYTVSQGWYLASEHISGVCQDSPCYATCNEKCASLGLLSNAAKRGAVNSQSALDYIGGILMPENYACNAYAARTSNAPRMTTTEQNAQCTYWSGSGNPSSDEYDGNGAQICYCATDPDDANVPTRSSVTWETLTNTHCWLQDPYFALADGTAVGHTGTEEECKQLCAADPTCTGFTRTTSNSLCYWHNHGIDEYNSVTFPYSLNFAGHDCVRITSVVYVQQDGFAGLMGQAFVAARALPRAELGLAIHQLAAYEGSVPTGANSRWYTLDGDLASYHNETSKTLNPQVPFTCDTPVDLTALCRDGTLTCTVSGQTLYGCANAPCADGYDSYEWTHLYDNDLTTKIHTQSTGGTNANWYGLGFGQDVYVTDVTWSSWQVGMHDRDVGGQIMLSDELMAYGSVWATEQASGFAATECGAAFPAKQVGVQNLERSCNAEASAIYVYHAQTHDGTVFSSEMKVMGCVVPTTTINLARACGADKQDACETYGPTWGAGYEEIHKTLVDDETCDDASNPEISVCYWEANKASSVFWRVDLGMVSQIARIKHFARNDATAASRAQGFRITVSNDDTVNDDGVSSGGDAPCFTHDGSTITSTTVTTGTCDAQGRYVFLTGPDANVNAREIQVFGEHLVVDDANTKNAAVTLAPFFTFKTFSSDATHTVISSSLSPNERLPTKQELRTYLAEFGAQNPGVDYWVPVWKDESLSVIDWLNEGGGGAHYVGKSLREPAPDGVGYADATVNAWTDPKRKYYVIQLDTNVDRVFTPAPARRLYALEVPSGQTLTAPLAPTFNWTEAWTIEAWLRPKQYNWALSALGATAHMSTTLAGSTGLPSDAIDGLTHTAWDSGPNGEDCAISAQNDASPWLMIDLKQTVSVQQVKVYGRSDSAAAPMKPFTIRVGDSATPTSNPVCHSSTTGLGSAESYQRLVACVGAGRYVSIETAGVDSGHYFSICEFQVFGHAMTLKLSDGENIPTDPVTVFTEHTDVDCEHTGADIKDESGIRVDFVGTVSECEAKCLDLEGCNGFIRLVYAHAPDFSCIFHEGVVTPGTATVAGRNCYIKSVETPPGPSVVTAVNSAVAIAPVRSYPPNEYLITKETSTSLTYTLGVPTTAAYGAGDYVLSTSGRNLNYDSMPINNLFGKGTATELGTVELSAGVAEASLPYSTSTGLANGNAADLLGTNSYRGDYITIEFPTALYMKSLILMIGNTLGQNGYGRLNYPVSFRVYADDNGSWVLLSEVTDAVYVSTSSTSFERARVIDATRLQYVDHTIAYVNANAAYSKFAIIFNKVAGTFPGYVQMHGLEFQASEVAQVWAPDTWTHVSLKHSNANTELFVNGALSPTGEIDTATLVQGGNLNITGGAVDDLRVFSLAPDAAPDSGGLSGN